jgi:AcrR family transcriptional regulator
MNRESSGRTPASDPGRSSGNREKILATALRLFTLQGVDATPTAQISREAKVSTGTLFHYFLDKNSLIDQVYLSIKKELAEVVRSNDDPTQPTKERIEQCLRGYIIWGVANPEKVRFLDQFYNSPSLGDEVKDQVNDEFAWMFELSDAAVREGILRDLPPEFHAVMISRVINGILTLTASNSTGMSGDEIIENGLAMLWK